MPFEQSSATTQSKAIAVLRQRLSGFETEEGRLHGLLYQPRTRDEVIITTTPKAGTTWLQQICHQIRSASEGGDMGFSEISEVVPWLELAHDQGQDIYAPQYREDRGIPRLFKTHAWYPHCPKGCKRIVVLRDPMDVLVSFYKFFQGWFFEDGEVSMDEFAQEFWLQRGVPQSRMNNASYFVHLVSWYQRRKDPDVLVVLFEDLKQDLRKEVWRVARFMSTEKHNFATQEIVDQVVERSSYEFMSSHASQFDEKLSKLARNEACGLPKEAGLGLSKLRNGSSGQGKILLSTQLQRQIMDKWKEVVAPETGSDTYEMLRRALHDERSPSNGC